jgi:hypothetical protein
VARYRRRRNGGIFNLLGDLFDDVYDFIDEDILDRGRDAERDLRRTGRNWTDSYDDDDRPRRARRRRYTRYEVEELREEIEILSRQISALELTGAK